MNVTWDPNKAKTNRNKHGISFSDAEAVLFDPNAISYEDEDAKGEQRHLSIGLDSLGRVLVVVYTYRADNIRLISARRATRKERQNYESRI
jgi:uncharacterized DUF497 family protein